MKLQEFPDMVTTTYATCGPNGTWEYERDDLTCTIRELYTDVLKRISDDVKIAYEGWINLLSAMALNSRFLVAMGVSGSPATLRVF